MDLCLRLCVLQGGATAKSRTKEEQAAQQQRDKSKETRRKGLKRL